MVDALSFSVALSFALLSDLLPNIYFLSKSLNLFGWHANQKVNLQKIFKNQFLRSHVGDKAETLHNCS